MHAMICSQGGCSYNQLRKIADVHVCVTEKESYVVALKQDYHWQMIQEYHSLWFKLSCPYPTLLEEGGVRVSVVPKGLCSSSELNWDSVCVCVYWARNIASYTLH